MKKRELIFLMIFFALLFSPLAIGIFQNYNLDFTCFTSLVYAQESYQELQIVTPGDKTDSINKDEIVVEQNASHLSSLELLNGDKPYRYFRIRNQQALPKIFKLQTQDNLSKISLATGSNLIPKTLTSFDLEYEAMDDAGFYKFRKIRYKVIDQNGKEVINKKLEDRKISQEKDNLNRIVGKDKNDNNVNLKNLRISEIKGKKLIDEIIPKYAADLKAKKKNIVWFKDDEQKNNYLQCANNFAEIYDEFINSDQKADAQNKLKTNLKAHKEKYHELNSTFEIVTE